MKRHALSAAAAAPVVVLLAALAAWAGVPAASAADEVGLSADRRSWHPELTRPLLDRPAVWVPGDSETVSFYVRNDGPTDARLTVDVVTDDGDSLVAGGDLAISVRPQGGEWVARPDGRTSGRLVSGALAQDGVTRVDARVDFRWSSPNSSQLDRAGLDFVVRLVQDGELDPDADGGPDDDTDEDAGTGLLPETGSPYGVGLVWLAAGLIGSGLALLVGARRRKEARDG